MFNITLNKEPFSVYRLYLFFSLVLLEMLMSFSFLGYFHIPPISITIAYLPILISAISLKIRHTVIIGIIFGLISAYKASVYYAMPADMIFSPLRSNAPLDSLFLSVGTRAIFALVIAYLFRLIKKATYRYELIMICGALAPLIHAAIVLFTMGKLFPQVGVNLANLEPFSLNNVCIEIFCALISVLCLWLHRNKHVIVLRETVDKYRGNPVVNIGLIGVGLFVFLIMTCVGFYSAARMEYMLGRYNIFVDNYLNHDLLHQQLQNTLAGLSLSLLLVMILLIGYRFMAYNGYLGELDALTNVLGRRIFFDKCQSLRNKFTKGSDKLWFLIVDIDLFKQINDSYGHLAGDHVLRSIAKLLMQIFNSHGIVGRIGGDEFAVLIYNPLPQRVMRDLLDDFFMELEKMHLPAQMKTKVSCSIGACKFHTWHDPQELMSKTDVILYLVKNSGRAGYIMGSDTDHDLYTKTKIFNTGIISKIMIPPSEQEHSKMLKP